MNKHKIALIGCGGRGRAHANGIRADERLQVVALADAKEEAAQALDSDYGFEAKIYTDAREMLEAERPEIVVVSLWTPLHEPMYRLCAESGVRAVLCEKPMAPTWAQCREMARLQEETGCQLTFSHQRRFAPGNILARQIINDGTIGTIERMDLYSPPNLLDCGTHTLDQALSFLNESPARWVLGAVDTSEVLKWFNVRAEKMAIGTIVFENGVRANLQVGGPDMDIWGGVRVIGSEGFLDVMWDGEFKRAVVYKQPDWKPPVVEHDNETHMIGLVRNAVDCLESGHEPEASCQKALRATEIIFALYESVRRGARVELPLQGVEDNPLHAMLDAAQ